MKRVFIGMLFVLSTRLFSQNGWYWQNPLPQGNPLHDVVVFDQNTAIAVGRASTVMKTVNGGTDWDIQYYAGETTAYLEAMHFVSSTTGWTVGYDGYNWDGVILKTTDGGSSWTNQVTNGLDDLRGVYFLDANTGWAVGYNTVLKTTNGGAN